MSSGWHLFVLVSCLVLQDLSNAVKIGISKTTTTTSTDATSTTVASTSTTTSTSISTDFPSTMIATTEGLTVTPPPTMTTTTKPRIFFMPTRKAATTSTTTIASITDEVATAEDDLQQQERNGYQNVTEHGGHIFRNYLLEHFFCDCNLMLYACDVNCCCDPECSKEALQVFDCFAESKHVELRSHLGDFQYQHGLPSCKVNDGWLCVFRTNTKTPVKKISHTNLDSTHNYKWPPLLLGTTIEEEPNFYKYGAALKLLNMATLEMEDFELPYSFKPPHCLSHEPITHLKSLKRICLVKSVEEMQEHSMALIRLAATRKLLAKPKRPAIEAINKTTTATNLLDIQIMRCIKNDKCQKLQAESNLTEVEMENYYVTAILVKILHNYTNIISSFIEQHVEEVEVLENVELWQKFEVKFIAINSTNYEFKDDELLKLLGEDDEKSHSGPLGYLKGEPLIIAKFIAHNSSQEMSIQNQVLNYFHANATKSQRNHTLSLFTKRQELCYRTEDKEHRINYGINNLKQCKVRLSSGDKPKENYFGRGHNFTAICLSLQEATLTALFGHISNIEKISEIYISKLGKAQNRTEHWLQLKVENAEFPPLRAQFNEDAQSFICHNILLGATYEFHVDSSDMQGIPNQALIKHARLILGQRNDLEFALDEVVEAPVTISVMFYDSSVDAANAAGFIVTNNLFYFTILFLPKIIFARY